MQNGRFESSLDRDIVTYSFDLGQAALARQDGRYRKQLGQFLTSPVIARYMARQLVSFHTGYRILDPAIGSGVLACAVIEHLIQIGWVGELLIEGYEVDPLLYEAACKALAIATNVAKAHGLVINTRIYHQDFVLAHAPNPQPALFPDANPIGVHNNGRYDLIIANPPYFKLNQDDRRVSAVTGLVTGHTNIYTLFMALSTRALADNGHACFIVPRSFCSGAYFAAFREDFITQATPLAVHLFSSRQDNFEADDVLQENVIITFKKQQTAERLPDHIVVTTSHNAAKLNGDVLHRQVAMNHFLNRRRDALFFRLPTTELDEQIIETVDSWPGSLAQYGLTVSTGPIVAFRARQFLREAEAVRTEASVPLLWMQNVSQQQVAWPVTRGKKPQAIAASAETESLLVPTANYVLLRRFSAKEEPRRLTAAALLHDTLPYNQIGLENHLNYIYRQEAELETSEAVGLSALLNSALLDRYFRISNGNTQVNATELRALPLPPLDVIKQLGKRIGVNGMVDDNLIFAVLREQGYLPADFPTIRETRYSMGKIQEAQDILKTLGLPRPQQNEMAALTLLVLAQLTEHTDWHEAQNPSLRIHDMLLEIYKRYDRQYAENTRETIRRQVIHQFVQAGIVIRNPDDPTLPTNSPRTHYALSRPMLDTIRAYKSNIWPQKASDFLENQRSLIETYRQQREQHLVPLVLEGGFEYHLSPGAHNELQVLIVEEFGPRFAPGATVLYVGDTADKTLHIDESGFTKLNIPIPNHDKLPDVVLYDEERNWLYLIEAVTSHGPISPKRQIELRLMLGQGKAELIFVTAFLDFNTYKNFILDIAWDTEVWIADSPSHLIHFNGDRFLGPRKR